jgi:hypothetical protein
MRKHYSNEKPWNNLLRHLSIVGVAHLRGRAGCSENTTINLAQKFIIYRWTFDGQKDGHISEIASLICRNKIRQKLDFVGVQGPPVLGGANDPAFAHQATVRRIGTVDERI